jgi:hypothetical protein
MRCGCETNAYNNTWDHLRSCKDIVILISDKIKSFAIQVIITKEVFDVGRE